MSEALEKLQSIGAQKIHEKTHIPVEHIKAILNTNYETLSKVQFLGFVSILERDYALDLSELRLAGVKFFEEKRTKSLNDGVFMPPPKKKKHTSFYILLAFVAIVFLVFINFDTSEEIEETPKVDSTLIMDVHKKIETATVTEENLTQTDANLSTEEVNASQSDANLTSVNENEAQRVVEKEPKSDSLKILAKKKLWFGYIDLDAGKNYQKVFAGEFELDTKKNWLLFFGHRFAQIELNGELVAFDAQKYARFLYKDGVLKPIDIEEFKRLNKGKEW